MSLTIWQRNIIRMTQKAMFYIVRAFAAISLAAYLYVFRATMRTLKWTTGFAPRPCQSHFSHKRDVWVKPGWNVSPQIQNIAALWRLRHHPEMADYNFSNWILSNASIWFSCVDLILTKLPRGTPQGYSVNLEITSYHFPDSRKMSGCCKLKCNKKHYS